jgi:hypothetical protein
MRCPKIECGARHKRAPHSIFGEKSLLTLTYMNLNGSCPLTGTTTGTIIRVQEPLLGVLADNGGPTWTRALTPGSPVIDQIPPAVCQDQFGTAPVPHQRGVARPVGLACDMGAYEGEQATPIYLHSLLPFSASGRVPVLARGCVVTLTLTRTSGPGTYNDGYADNISLVLVPPPLFLPLLMR